jgi:hypothetical protein
MFLLYADIWHEFQHIGYVRCGVEARPLKESMNCSVPSLRKVYFQVLHVIAGEIFDNDKPAGNQAQHKFEIFQGFSRHFKHLLGLRYGSSPMVPHHTNRMSSSEARSTSGSAWSSRAMSSNVEHVIGQGFSRLAV